MRVSAHFRFGKRSSHQGHDDGSRPIPPRNGSSTRTSTLLLTSLEEWPHDVVTLADIMALMGRRSYGLVLLLLNLPNLIPLPLPVLSTILGPVIACVAVQMFLRRMRPILPDFLLRRSFKRAQLYDMVKAAVPRLRRFEAFLKPRFSSRTHARLQPIAGFFLSLFAIVLAFPIPFGNLVLAIPIAVVALGLIESDGVCIILGICAGLLALGFNAVIGASVIWGIVHAFRHFTGL